MKKIILGMSALMLALSSCDGFLTEEPTLSQSNELTLSKHLDEATAGCYARLQSYSWYGANYILAAELTCGNALHTSTLPGSNRYTNSSEAGWNFTQTNTSPIWSYAYYTINCCNEVINNINGNTATGVSQQDLDNWRAEALFMRALSHFNLVTTYALSYKGHEGSLGVPVMTVANLSAKPARNTVAQVYDQVVKDLEEADSLMAPGYEREGTDPLAFASKTAIEALLSRVHLYMGNWQKAADYATLVIKSGKYSLADQETYRTMWTAQTAAKGGEVIFEIYGSNKNAYWDGSGWEQLPYITDPAGSGDVAATRSLYEMYDEGDVRKELFTFNEQEPFSTKYAGKAGSSTPKENNIVVLRLSEMYLNRAEALTNGAVVPGESAQGDLNAITDARGAQRTVASKLFDERRKELAFEGHLYYDYKRLNKALTRNGAEFSNLTNCNVAADSYLWAYPISKSELDANPNMVQNEGYGK